MTINEWIKTRRRAKGLSQENLAKKTGISQSRLSQIEKGADHRLSTLLQIARALESEPVLVPKELLPFVNSLLDPQATKSPRLVGTHPEDEDLDNKQSTNHHDDDEHEP